MASATVNGSKVRLRRTPAGEIITELSKGVGVEAFETIAGWTRVNAPGEEPGWIKAELLRSATPVPTAFDRDAFFARADAMPGYLSASQRLAIDQVLDACQGMPTSWTAYVLATAAHETGRTFDASKEENLNYRIDALKQKFGGRMSQADCERFGRGSNQPAHRKAIANRIYGGAWGRENLGNTRSGDGWKFRGRGWVQVTGRANYARASQRLGLGDTLIADPDRVSELAICAGIVERGMTEGWFRREKLSDHLPTGRVLATMAQFARARGIINGGGDMDDEIAIVAVDFQRVLAGAGWSGA